MSEVRKFFQISGRSDIEKLETLVQSLEIVEEMEMDWTENDMEVD